MTQTIPESYYEQGFFVLPGLFSPARCQAVIDEAEAVLGQRDAERKSVINAHREIPAFFDMMADPILLDPVAQLVHGTPTGLQTQFYFNDPGTKGFTAHQDNYFVEAPPDAFVSAWIALVDVDRDNGALIAWPGTNRLGALPVDSAVDPVPGIGQHINARKEESRIPPGYAPVDVELSRGSVLFIDGWVVHASHTNVSQRNRYALLCTYLREGAPFRPGNQAKRSPINLVKS